MSNEMAHSKLGASSASRWMTCPGSVALCSQMPEEKSSAYADEGTLAHKLAEFCIRNTCSPLIVSPKQLGVTEIPDDMAEAVAKYIDHVISIASFKDVQVEVKFHLDYINEDMFGTNDAMIYDAARKKLTILDYKHGRGEVVEARDNPQLRYYALGALNSLFEDAVIEETSKILSIDLTIVQPRAYHEDGPIRTETITVAELYTWEKDYLVPAVRKIESGDRTLYPNPKACRWCKAKPICTAILDEAVSVAKVDFANPVFPNPSSLNLAQLTKVLAFAEGFDSFSDSCKAYAQLLAEGGTTIPGYKLVRGRSIRQWDENLPIAENLSFMGGQEYERKLKSPAQIEKTLKAMKAKFSIEPLTVKPEGKLKLVPEGDNRDTVCSSPAIDYIDVFN